MESNHTSTAGSPRRRLFDSHPSSPDHARLLQEAHVIAAESQRSAPLATTLGAALNSRPTLSHVARAQPLASKDDAVTCHATSAQRWGGRGLSGPPTPSKLLLGSVPPEAMVVAATLKGEPHLPAPHNSVDPHFATPADVRWQGQPTLRVHGDPVELAALKQQLALSEKLRVAILCGIKAGQPASKILEIGKAKKGDRAVTLVELQAQADRAFSWLKQARSHATKQHAVHTEQYERLTTAAQESKAYAEQCQHAYDRLIREMEVLKRERDEAVSSCAQLREYGVQVQAELDLAQAQLRQTEEGFAARIRVYEQQCQHLESNIEKLTAANLQAEESLYALERDLDVLQSESLSKSPVISPIPTLTKPPSSIYEESARSLAEVTTEREAALRANSVVGSLATAPKEDSKQVASLKSRIAELEAQREEVVQSAEILVKEIEKQRARAKEAGRQVQVLAVQLSNVQQQFQAEHQKICKEAEQAKSERDPAQTVCSHAMSEARALVLQLYDAQPQISLTNSAPSSASTTPHRTALQRSPMCSPKALASISVPATPQLGELTNSLGMIQAEMCSLAGELCTPELEQQTEYKRPPRLSAQEPPLKADQLQVSLSTVTTQANGIARLRNQLENVERVRLGSWEGYDTLSKNLQEAKEQLAHAGTKHEQLQADYTALREALIREQATSKAQEEEIQAHRYNSTILGAHLHHFEKEVGKCRETEPAHEIQATVDQELIKQLTKQLDHERMCTGQMNRKLQVLHMQVDALQAELEQEKQQSIVQAEELNSQKIAARVISCQLGELQHRTMTAEEGTVELERTVEECQARGATLEADLRMERVARIALESEVATLEDEGNCLRRQLREQQQCANAKDRDMQAQQEMSKALAAHLTQLETQLQPVEADSLRSHVAGEATSPAEELLPILMLPKESRQVQAKLVASHEMEHVLQDRVGMLEEELAVARSIGEAGKEEAHRRQASLEMAEVAAAAACGVSTTQEAVTAVAATELETARAEAAGHTAVAVAGAGVAAGENRVLCAQVAAFEVRKRELVVGPAESEVIGEAQQQNVLAACMQLDEMPVEACVAEGAAEWRLAAAERCPASLQMEMGCAAVVSKAFVWDLEQGRNTRVADLEGRLGGADWDHTLALESKYRREDTETVLQRDHVRTVVRGSKVKTVSVGATASLREQAERDGDVRHEMETINGQVEELRRNFVAAKEHAVGLQSQVERPCEDQAQNAAAYSESQAEIAALGVQLREVALRARLTTETAALREQEVAAQAHANGLAAKLAGVREEAVQCEGAVTEHVKELEATAPAAEEAGRAAAATLQELVASEVMAVHAATLETVAAQERMAAEAVAVVAPGGNGSSGDGGLSQAGESACSWLRDPENTSPASPADLQREAHMAGERAAELEAALGLVEHMVAEQEEAATLGEPELIGQVEAAQKALAEQQASTPRNEDVAVNDCADAPSTHLACVESDVAMAAAETGGSILRANIDAEDSTVEALDVRLRNSDQDLEHELQRRPEPVTVERVAMDVQGTARVPLPPAKPSEGSQSTGGNDASNTPKAVLNKLEVVVIPHPLGTAFLSDTETLGVAAAIHPRDNSLGNPVKVVRKAVPHPLAKGPSPHQAFLDTKRAEATSPSGIPWPSAPVCIPGKQTASSVVPSPSAAKASGQPRAIPITAAIPGPNGGRTPTRLPIVPPSARGTAPARRGKAVTISKRPGSAGSGAPSEARSHY